MNTLILGGVPLNSQMVWVDRFQQSKVAQEVLTTLGGAPVVNSAQLLAGFPITLQATDNRGWLTLDMVEQISALADVAGTQMELQINDKTYTVMFRHNDAPAFIAEPLIPRFNHQPGDKFTATIKLITL